MKKSGRSPKTDLRAQCLRKVYYDKMNAQSVISILSKKYNFDAGEALTFINEYKVSDDAGSITSISTVQRAENALNKTKAEIEDLKSKITSKKGKMLEKANEKLAKLELKALEQSKKVDEKLAKEKPAKEKPAKEKPAKEKPAKEKPAKEKRISRMTPTLTKSLTEVFDNKKKEFTKDIGSGFAKIVNEMSKEDFEAKPLADHMRDYADTFPSKETLMEPDAVEDEDMTEVEFNGVKYVVGDISKRVYEADETNGYKHVGFIGIGKFVDMKI